MDENNMALPTHDPLDDVDGGPLPADHGEKCRRMAQDLATAERLLYRLANGDKDAAIQLKGLSAFKSYTGCQLVWTIEELLANVLE